VFPAFLPAYDAIASLCHLLQLLASVDQPLSSLVDTLPQPSVVHRAVRCPFALKGTVMRVLTERMKEEQTDTLDGLKVIGDEGWAQIIPDPEEPLVHVYAEGKTLADAERLAAELRRTVEEIIDAERTS
jgi:mannose-1-phosphate guanylyltransferase/phosphomannomutase